mgnify:CR=1 FL=1
MCSCCYYYYHSFLLLLILCLFLFPFLFYYCSWFLFSHSRYRNLFSPPSFAFCVFLFITQQVTNISSVPNPGIICGYTNVTYISNFEIIFKKIQINFLLSYYYYYYYQSSFNPDEKKAKIKLILTSSCFTSCHHYHYYYYFSKSF